MRRVRFLASVRADLLDQIRQRLQQDPAHKTIDVLMIRSDRKYSEQLLARYIAELGIKFIVFSHDDHFDGWIEAPLFSAQLARAERTASYDELRSRLGVRTETVSPSTSAVDTLKSMEKSRLSSIAVVDSGQFRFIASRDGIVAKLLVASIAPRPTP